MSGGSPSPMRNLSEIQWFAEPSWASDGSSIWVGNSDSSALRSPSRNRRAVSAGQSSKSVLPRADSTPPGWSRPQAALPQM